MATVLNVLVFVINFAATASIVRIFTTTSSIPPLPKGLLSSSIWFASAKMIKIKRATTTIMIIHLTDYFGPSADGSNWSGRVALHSFESFEPQRSVLGEAWSWEKEEGKEKENNDHICLVKPGGVIRVRIRNRNVMVGV
ncbi:hypothetical protein L1987_14078 [Smallanthus sonchifolius]|uniref:Uncharacterized protein n=1 Tax=Smallanthus sonchifolius TaxID=185202 RepID=A0ACB9J3B8_9ASTR|nr:hypothetical protein L1987_14078 [Smallanthus sonchifolius]